MAWSARREGMVLEVAEVPDDVALYINAKANGEGKSVDDVVCEMLAKAKNGTHESGSAPRRPLAPSAPHEQHPLTLYGVRALGNEPLRVESVRARETPKRYMLATEPNVFGGKTINKESESSMRCVGFSRRDALEKYVTYMAEWVVRYERRLGDEDVLKDARIQQSLRSSIRWYSHRINEARGMLAAPTA